MIKRIIKKILRTGGYEVKRLYQGTEDIGTDRRPVGRMDLMLEDMKKRGLDCKMILDVGANMTHWSRIAKRIFPASSFYLIEPQIEMKGELEKFCNEFSNASYILAGAAAKKEVLTLTVWDDLAGSSFLPEADPGLKSKGKQRDIEMITIDDLISSSVMKMPDLVKLDIQGFELEALKGAGKTFGYTEAYILEVSLYPFSDVPGIPVIHEVINFMNERNYVVYDFPGFLRRPLDGALGQCDICFVKKEGLFRKSNEWA